MLSGRHLVDLLETSSSSNPLSPRALTPQFGRHLVDWEEVPEKQGGDKTTERPSLTAKALCLCVVKGEGEMGDT